MSNIYYDDQTFMPVKNIYCLGLNYKNHIHEMKHSLPSEPVIFIKNVQSICHNHDIIEIPETCKDFQYEVELVVSIGKEGYRIPKGNAMEYIKGYGVGIDFTMRDKQAEAKAKGLPWTLSKSFRQSAFVSQFVNYQRGTDLHQIDISLRVNEQIRQYGNTKDMIFKLDEIISYLSEYFLLSEGDLIFTGTPEGVGTLNHGDIVEVFLNQSKMGICTIQ